MRLHWVCFLLFASVAFGHGPNVIIFYADDMGHGDVGCYGCEDIRTPNIDALAANGVRFTNYYATDSLCSPSRASLLTGRYSIRAGVPSNVSSRPGRAGMPSSEITIAELAKTRGYATALIGKWHLGFSDGTRPNDQGFDLFFGFHAGCIDYYSHMFYWQEPHHHDLYRNREEIREEGQYMTDLITRESISFIEAHRDTPFLLYAAFNAPHYPMQSPQRFRDMYSHLPPLRRDYAALVAGLDESIGRIVQTVDKAGIAKETLYFFASDNGATIELRGNGGGGSNAPFRAHKSSLFDGGTRLPAIISWPGQIPSGAVRDQLSCVTDVFPTVAEMIGAELPKDRVIDGRSWRAMLKDANAPGHERLCWKHGPQSAIREGRWKLTVNGLDTAEGGKKTPLTGEDQLFLADLQEDPAEIKNLRHEHPQLAERLHETLKHWHTDVSTRK